MWLKCQFSGIALFHFRLKSSTQVTWFWRFGIYKLTGEKKNNKPHLRSTYTQVQDVGYGSFHLKFPHQRRLGNSLQKAHLLQSMVERASTQVKTMLTDNEHLQRLAFHLWVFSQSKESVHVANISRTDDQSAASLWSWLYLQYTPITMHSTKRTIRTGCMRNASHGWPSKCCLICRRGFPML